MLQNIKKFLDFRKLVPRGFLFFVVGCAFLVILLFFQNCGNQKAYEESSPSTIPVENSPESRLNEFEGVRILNSDVYMNCTDDHVQVGGVCNDGGSVDNFIRYSMTHNRQKVVWGNPPSTVEYLDSSRCDNGRWVAIVPKPNHPSLTTGTAFSEFEVTFQIYMKGFGQSQYRAGSKTPAYTISIQQAGACL
jgi:hypothetical protein